MKVQEYLREDNASPYQKWFNTLDATAAAKVAVAVSRLELGNTSNIKWFDGIGEYIVIGVRVIAFT
jgi:putative component of toxin-antitoxin plasmid stabilization module